MTDQLPDEGLRRFSERLDKTEAIKATPLIEARSESSNERRDLARKPIKTIIEWQRVFTDHLNHPEDTGDFKHVVSTFLMDIYPRDKESDGYVASVDDFDFAVTVESQRYGSDEAVKKVRNRFINWLTWKHPEEVKEMRDEAKNLIFNIGSKKAHTDGLGYSVLETFLEKVEERPLLGMLTKKYEGQDPEVWQDRVAGSFLEYLKGYGEFEILKDIASVVNQNIKKDKSGRARADASSHVRNDKGKMEVRKRFQPDQKQMDFPEPETQETNVPIELSFNREALDRLTNGLNQANMIKEGLRVRKAFEVFKDAWSKGNITRIMLGLDGMKVSAIIFRSRHYDEDFVLPIQYVRSVLGIYPLQGYEVPGSRKFSKGYTVGIKFKPDFPAPHIYAGTPILVIKRTFCDIKLDGKPFTSKPWFEKAPYKYLES